MVLYRLRRPFSTRNQTSRLRTGWCMSFAVRVLLSLFPSPTNRSLFKGILSGTAIPLGTILGSIQGARWERKWPWDCVWTWSAWHLSSFTQLLQQTGVIDQLQQSGRPYTLFVPTNAALQSIGVTTDVNRIRQVDTFVYRWGQLAFRVLLSLLVCSPSRLHRCTDGSDGQCLAPFRRLLQSRSTLTTSS